MKIKNRIEYNEWIKKKKERKEKRKNEPTKNSSMQNPPTKTRPGKNINTRTNQSSHTSLMSLHCISPHFHFVTRRSLSLSLMRPFLSFLSFCFVSLVCGGEGAQCGEKEGVSSLFVSDVYVCSIVSQNLFWIVLFFFVKC